MQLLLVTLIIACYIILESTLTRLFTQDPDFPVVMVLKQYKVQCNICFLRETSK